MISFEDGRINPFSLLQTLDKYLKHKKVNYLREEIIKIRRSNNQWISTTKNNENIKSDLIILCNSLKAIDLIDSLSHNIRLKPVLGQAMEMDINDAEVNLLLNFCRNVIHCGHNSMLCFLRSQLLPLLF